MSQRRSSVFPLSELDFDEVYSFLARPKTVDEIIDWLGMGSEIIHAAIRDGRLATRKLEGRTVVFNEDVKRFLASFGPCGAEARRPTQT